MAAAILWTAMAIWAAWMTTATDADEFLLDKGDGKPLATEPSTDVHVSVRSKLSERSFQKWEMRAPCGETSSQACASLLHGLQEVERRFGDRNLSEVSPWVRVLLHTNISYSCRVPAGFSGPHELSAHYTFSLTKVKIRPSEEAVSSGCERVTLGVRRPRLSPDTVRVTLNGSKAVHIQNVTFPSSHVVLRITRSAMVYLDNCGFQLCNSSDDGNTSRLSILRIRDSHDVFITNCEFTPESGSLQAALTDLDISKWNSPVVNVEFNRGDNVSEEVNASDLWSDRDIKLAYDIMKRNYMCGSVNTDACYAGGQGRDTPSMNMGVFFGRCTFSNLGYKFLATTPYKVSRKKCRGNVLHVSFRHGTQWRSVIVHNSTFSGNSHPQNSPLTITFSSANRGTENESKTILSNLVVISESSFLQNKALVGGAAQVYFNGSVEYNLVKLLGVRFHGNTARQVGGALALHYSIKASEQNCIVTENTSFVGNYLRHVEDPKSLPGGAIYLYRSQVVRSSLQRLRSMSPEAKRLYQRSLSSDEARGCSEKVGLTMTNSHFIGNLGFGAVYARNTGIVFSGER